jgi:hypothetical protein
MDSKRWKTWLGSLVELQAVKPTISAKEIVAAGNKSAIGALALIVLGLMLTPAM